MNALCSRSLFGYILVALLLLSCAVSVPARAVEVLFTQNLVLGSEADDVLLLQQYLNEQGFLVSKEGAGSPGNETRYFGPATRAALIRFQEANSREILAPLGLVVGTGNFFDATRAFVNRNLETQGAQEEGEKETDKKSERRAARHRGYEGGTIMPTPPAYAIRGTVTGLSGSGLVLKNNDGDNLAISENGSFTFTAAINTGGTYSVTVGTQPSSPSQICTVTNGSGTVAGSDVTNISVSCANATFTVGGTVSGLIGTVQLQNSGADTLTLSSNGSFTFATPVSVGNAYIVTVLSQPMVSTCSVINGSGIVGSANVTNVAVVCLSDA